MTIKKLWNEFHSLPEADKVDILLQYTTYVEEYPDEHDEGSYPACFMEWYTNDYEERIY